MGAGSSIGGKVGSGGVRWGGVVGMGAGGSIGCNVGSGGVRWGWGVVRVCGACEYSGLCWGARA